MRLKVPLLCAAMVVSSEASAQRGVMPCPFSSGERSALGWRHDTVPGRVSGRIVDVSTGEPVLGASVRLDVAADTLQLDSIVLRDNRGVRVAYRHPGRAKYRTLTDSSGRFQLDSVSTGQYRVTVLSAGVLHTQDTVTIGGGGIRLLAGVARWDGDIVCIAPAKPPIAGFDAGHLTRVAAVGGAVERAEALACARVHGAILYDPPQQNAVR
jgi:hypothetical protein